jgi:prolipoprotein diacylglyceryltransferase
MEFTLLWAALSAVVLAWVGLRLWPERVPEHGFDRLLGAAVAGLVVGRLVAMATRGINPLSSPGDILIVRGGVHTGAAALTFAVVLWWGNRNDPFALDALAPAVLLAVAGWHGGCLWRGACLGTASALPWAQALDGSTVTRHPVELYVALALALGAWGVSRLGWRPFLRAGSALAIASLLRLITEPLRPSITGGPRIWYLAGVVVGLTLIVIGPRLTRDDASDLRP